MQIHTEIHNPPGTPAGAVVIVHGAGEHAGRYGHVIEAFTRSGYLVVIGDLPGHGRSGGLRGHVESFEEYLDAVDGWAAEAARRIGPDGKFSIVGHSMGGLITIRFLEERAGRHPQLIAAVLSSPALGVALEVPVWKRMLANVLNRLAPRLRMDSGIKPSDVSRSPDVVAGYESDPLVGSKVSVRWYHEFTASMEKAMAGASRIAVPVLLMQAGQDRLVAPQEAPRFFGRLPEHEASRFLPFPELYHELFNEPEQDEVLAEMLNWLNIRFGAAAPEEERQHNR